MTSPAPRRRCSCRPRRRSQPTSRSDRLVDHARVQPRSRHLPARGAQDLAELATCSVGPQASAACTPRGSPGHQRFPAFRRRDHVAACRHVVNELAERAAGILDPYKPLHQNLLVSLKLILQVIRAPAGDPRLPTSPGRGPAASNLVALLEQEDARSVAPWLRWTGARTR